MPLPTPSRAAAIAAVSVLLAVLAVLGQRLAGAGAASAPEPVAALEPVAVPSTARRLVVHVVGAVRRPGLYRLPERARVADAVARAGGAIRGADLAGLNLAAPLVDGTQVLVPARVVGVVAGVPAAEAGSTAGAPGLAGAARKLSLATATAEQLDELPGVGPVTAQKILDYRAQNGPFRSVDDLDAVPGIGLTRIEQLRDLVTP